MIETKQFARKPFVVDAVQVTEENMEELAEWCRGDIRTERPNRKYIKVRVHLPKSPRQSKAYVGDWILYANSGFKVYTPNAFEKSFEPVLVHAEGWATRLLDQAFGVREYAQANGHPEVIDGNG